MSQIIRKIYLHWTGTNYNWADPGHYHTVVLGNGTIRRLTGYDQPLTSHTYARNSNAVSITTSCMGGVAWKDFPPTDIQVDNMCREVASLAKQIGWKATDISLAKVLTHAEAGANKDFTLAQAKSATGVSFETARARGLPHENYGPMSWSDGWPGGTADRWDFWQVKPSDRGGEGGEILRRKIRQFMDVAPSKEVSQIGQTSNNNQCRIFYGSQQISVGYILANNRAYAKLRDLITPLGVKLGEFKGGSVRFINLLSDVAPKYLADSPIIPGFPLVDIYMNRPQDVEGNPVGDQDKPSRPFLQGIIVEQATFVLVADFCGEFGLSFSFSSSDKAIRIQPK